MKLQSNNNTSFGWHYKMHSDIVQKSTQKKNLPVSFINILKKSVEKPDFEEFVLYGQKHFYFPNDRIKSYLDYTGTHNAKYMYNKHIKNMDSAQNTEEFLDEAGRALHYLQDITQPHHIESGSIIKKAKDAMHPHHEFEMMIYDQQEKLTPNKPKTHLKSNNFQELFDETVNLSLQNQVPKNDNKEEWINISKYAIDLTIASTEKFLDIMKKHLFS